MSEILDKNVRQQGSEAGIGLTPVLGDITPQRFTLPVNNWVENGILVEGWNTINPELFLQDIGMTPLEFCKRVRNGDILKITVRIDGSELNCEVRVSNVLHKIRTIEIAALGLYIHTSLPPQPLFCVFGMASGSDNVSDDGLSFTEILITRVPMAQ